MDSIIRARPAIGRASSASSKLSLYPLPDTTADKDNIPMNRSSRFRATRDEKIAMAGAALTVIGAFLPWAIVFGKRFIGIHHDGLLTFTLALIAGSVIVFGTWGRLSRALVGLCGLLIFFIGLYDMTAFSGSGIYLTILGGFVTMGAPILPYLSE